MPLIGKFFSKSTASVGETSDLCSVLRSTKNIRQRILEQIRVYEKWSEHKTIYLEPKETIKSNNIPAVYK